METFFFFFIFIALIVLIYELLAHFQDGNILLYKSKKAMEEKGLTTYDFDPSRCYRYYPKTGEFSTSDFYWE